ncbi:IclR family transcriptional regulator [Pseudactinotalea sp.]|uniref:IclR family transcriptional regulator n=1 Tax=Pseudactinotalea sp. TaxID=1926260 RepID=UPI003B3A36D7
MLAKGLQVLQYLVEHPEHESGVSDVARALGLPVSTAHRLLGTLLATDWVSRAPHSSSYRLGPQVLNAAETLRSNLGLTDMHGVLADLATRVSETVILGTLIGGQFIYLDVVHGPGLLGIQGSVGRRGALHSTATGKALLCALPTERRNALIDELELTRLTPSTITDREALRAEIERSLERGYTRTDEENEAGVTSIGIPIRIEQDPDGVYAVCIAAPTQRASSRVESFHAALVQARTLLRTAGVSPR